MKRIQKFSDEYLERCRDMTHDQIIRFLEDFRRLRGRAAGPSKQISIKVPKALLDAFRTKTCLSNTPYQT